MKESIKSIIRDEGGGAVVEATILFPIIFMIFFAFTMLAIYLPTSVALQRSVEKAALIVSSHRSDLGYIYDISSDKAGVDYNKLRQESVYAYMTRGFGDENDIAGKIVEKYAADTLYKGKNLQISFKQDPSDKRYIVVTAEQTLEMPFDFPILPISKTFTIRKSARAIIHDADEFIRNMDIVYDLVIKKAEAVKETIGGIKNFLSIFNRVKGFFNS